MSALRTAATLSAAFAAGICLFAGMVRGEPKGPARQSTVAEAPWPKLAADQRNSGMGPACRLQGRVAWKAQLPSQIAQSPVIGSNERVFAACLDGTVICIDGDTGHEVWRSELKRAVRGAPVVADPGILVVNGSDAAYGLNAADGTRIWQWKPGGNMSGSVGLGNDGAVFVTTKAGTLACLDGRSGRLRWSADAAPMVASCPATYNGRVYGTDIKSTFAARQSDGQLVRSRSLNNRTTTLPAERPAEGTGDSGERAARRAVGVAVLRVRFIDGRGEEAAGVEPLGGGVVGVGDTGDALERVVGESGRVLDGRVAVDGVGGDLQQVA